MHVVPFHESGQSADGKVFWIVLEIVNGLTLREVLKTSGPLDEAEAIKVSLSSSSFITLDLEMSDAKVYEP